MEPNSFKDGYKPYWEYRWDSPTGGNGTSTRGEGADFYHNFLRRIIASEGIETMLDVGCGALNQWPDECLVDQTKFVGADVSEKALALAQAKWPRAAFLQVDASSAESLKNLPASDLVTCSDMLNHLRQEDFETAVAGILFAAEKAVVIRMWTKQEWEGLGGYHWSHELPQRQGWHLQVLDTPDNAAPWKLHYYRKDL